jgi:hypothetical protein
LKDAQATGEALKRENPALQNMKILAFFLFLRVIFSLLDPDPAPETQKNADPDPKPRYKQCSRSAWICNEIYYFDLLDRIFLHWF